MADWERVAELMSLYYADRPPTAVELAGCGVTAEDMEALRSLVRSDVELARAGNLANVREFVALVEHLLEQRPDFGR